MSPEHKGTKRDFRGAQGARLVTALGPLVYRQDVLPWMDQWVLNPPPGMDHTLPWRKGSAKMIHSSRRNRNWGSFLPSSSPGNQINPGEGVSHCVVITSPPSQSQLRDKLSLPCPPNCIRRKLESIRQLLKTLHSAWRHQITSVLHL